MNKSQILATSTQFKSINEAFTVFLKLNISTRMNQFARQSHGFHTDLLRIVEPKELVTLHNFLN